MLFNFTIAFLVVFGIPLLIAILICIPMSESQSDSCQVFLSNEQPLCTIKGKDDYIEWEGNTCYFFTMDKDGRKHRESINASNVYIIESSDKPVLKTYMHKYWDLDATEEIDHYEFCLPSYDFSIESPNQENEKGE